MLGCLVAGASEVSAADFTLTGSDAAGASSFNGIGTQKWPGGAAPVAGKTYATGSFILRGPTDKNSYIFAGDSLTIDPFAAAGTGRLLLKTAYRSDVDAALPIPTYTVNLILNGGLIDQATGGAVNKNVSILAGTMSVNVPSALGANGQETLIINSNVTGSAGLQIGGAVHPNGALLGNALIGTVVLGNANTGYTGNISVGTVATNPANVALTSNAVLQGRNTGTTNVLQAFGTGSISLNSGTGATGTTALQLRADGSASGQTIITGDGTLGNNVTLGGNATINADRFSGTNTGSTFQFNNLTIGGQTLTVTGANGYGVQFAGTTALTGNAVFKPDSAALSLTNVSVADSVGTGSITTATLRGTATTNIITGVISDNGLDATKKMAVTKNDGGKWTLSQDQTYTGLTTISNGTLELGTGGTTGSINNTSGVLFTNTATLSFNRSTDQVFSKDITVTGGNANFATQPGQSLTLTGNLSGAGELWAAGGTLKLEPSGTNTISGNKIMTNGATLELSNLNHAGTTGNFVFTSSAGTFRYTGASVNTDRFFNDNFQGGNPVIEVTNAATTLGITSVMGGDGNFTKTGAGTLVLGATNIYTASTRVHAGMLLINGSINSTSALAISGTGKLKLGASNVLNDIATLTLDGGIFDTAGFSETLGAMTLGGDAVFDLGAGSSILHLADSSGAFWTDGAELSILNWDGNSGGLGTDQLFFGTDAAGLGANLDAVHFINPAGFAPGTYSAQILNTGEVVAVVPEPGTVSAFLVGFGLLLGLRRRPQRRGEEATR